MDVAMMVAINNLNMVTVMAVQAANNVITNRKWRKDGRRYGGFNVRSVYGKRLYGKSVQ